MDVLGRGMLARAFESHRHEHPDVIAFAKGVATSAPLEATAYDREASELYDAIARCRLEAKRLLYFSSGGAIYGPSGAPRAETDGLYPQTAYGRHQVFCEAVIRASGVPYLIVRLPNVVGDRANSRQLVPSLVRQCLDGLVRIQRDATRDIIGVEDTARLVVRLLHVCRDSQLVQVASAVSLPVPEIVAEIQSILGTSAREDLREGGDRQAFDTRKLREHLGDEAAFTEDYPLEVLRRHVPEIARHH